jgi:glycosyltransferase involved in cell wall biosynthesis
VSITAVLKVQPENIWLKGFLMKISIVIPLYNEAESLGPLLKSISVVMDKVDASWEAVLVDDGSTDGSFGVCSKLFSEYPGHIRAYSFSRNYGKSAALSVGIQNASGDIIVTMDADLQDDPAAIPDMIKLLDSNWDVVSGWKKKRHDPLSKTIPSKAFNTLTSAMSGLRLHDFNCGFKAYRARAAKSLEIYGERHRYLPVLAHWNGYRVTEMPVPHHPRKYGKSKFGLGRASGMFDLLTLVFLRSYLRKPLHFFGPLGGGLILAGISVLGYFGVTWAITGQMHIRPLVLLSMGAVIMGIQFVSIGLIGELIINSNPKPGYVIRETLG